MALRRNGHSVGVLRVMIRVQGAMVTTRSVVQWQLITLTGGEGSEYYLFRVEVTDMMHDTFDRT